MSSFIARMVGALTMIGFISTAIAQAQTPSDQSTPAPQPTPQRVQINSNDGHGAEYFVSGDDLFTPNNNNQYNPYGIKGRDSFAARAAAEHPFGKLAVMAEGTYDLYNYETAAGEVPNLGKTGSTYEPAFNARTSDWDGRVGVGLPYPRVFFVASYADRQNNYGYPSLHGAGFGFEKLPDFDHKMWSFFGSYLYYPSFSSGSLVQYGFYKYEAGLEFHLNTRKVPAFVEVGYRGDYGYDKRNAPTSISDQALFAGLGFHM